MILVAAPANDSISGLVVTAKAGLGIFLYTFYFRLSKRSCRLSPYRGKLRFLGGTSLIGGSCSFSTSLFLVFFSGSFFSGSSCFVVDSVLQPCQRGHVAIPVNGDSGLLPSIASCICHTGKLASTIQNSSREMYSPIGRHIKNN